MTANTSYDLNVDVTIQAEGVPVARLREALEWLLRQHRVAPGTGISVVITDDDEIQRLNREFRQVDRPTDVLSFPAGPSPIPDDPEPYLGDLVLALPYIQRQALSEQHAWTDEIVLAVVHGTLHLLGYDHDTLEHQAAMWAIQAQALAALGVAITVPLFSFDDEDDSPPASS